EHYLAILDKLLPRWRLLVITMEQGALRPGEAIGLRWGDVDASASRLRLSASRTKTGRARWVQLPKWLTDAIEATCPLEDRTDERKVFQGLNYSAASQAMSRACRLAKIPTYTLHGMRHRRITLWHHEGVPLKVIAERAGHSNRP
ncbi:MAG TPA: site-specific integrase, partial [Gaiellaceae bacterium]|nr:site-specific integrase [Gaiellaceae bacterium]